MKRIHNITVGIDFSTAARNAFRYASSLAETLGATLTLVHVKEYHMIVSDVVTPTVPSEENEECIREMEQMVAAEYQGTIRPEGVKVKVLNGNAVSIFSELPGNTGTDLIVLGATGRSDILTKVVGSTSFKVSNQGHCPVILVPMYTKWRPIEQILFASDHDSMTSNFVNRITDFALNVKACIHFVNVRNYDPILEPKQKDIVWGELLAGSTSDQAYKKITIYGNDTTSELIKYSETHNINLLAFVSKHRHFWSDLIHKSVSAGVSMSTIAPIMVIHLDDQV